MVTGTQNRFLKIGVALGTVYKYLQGHLFWLPLVTNDGIQVGGQALIPSIRETSDAFMYLSDQYTITGDPKKEMAPIVVSGANLPEIDRSRKTSVSAVLSRNGFQMRIPRTILRSTSEGSVAELNEDFEYAAYWLAELLNSKIMSAATGGAYTSATKFVPGAVWSDTANALPYKDLKNFARDFKYDIFRLTDVIGHENSFYELGDYIENLDVNEWKQQKLYGIPTQNADSIIIPAVGTFHNFGSDATNGITDGYLLGLDRNHPAMEYHYYVDEAYSQPTVTYETMLNGQLSTVTVKNIGIHYKTEEADNEDTIMKFWVECKPIVKKQRGLLYLNGV